jgi:hypothetical protein
MSQLLSYEHKDLEAGELAKSVVPKAVSSRAERNSYPKQYTARNYKLIVKAQ